MMSERQLLMSKMSDLQVQIQEVETISKKAVIDAFKVWLIDNNDMRRFEEVVKDLKPVAQKKHECDFHADWQPISDGLLPDAGEYFVTWDVSDAVLSFVDFPPVRAVPEDFLVFRAKTSARASCL